jgi:hypothetical protein
MLLLLFCYISIRPLASRSSGILRERHSRACGGYPMLVNWGPSDDLDGVVSAPSLHLDRQKFYWPTREIHLRHAHKIGLHGELRRSHLERAAACRYARAKRSITLMMA